MKYAAGKPISEQANYTDIISRRFATPPLSRIPRMMPCAGLGSASYPAHSRLQQWAVKAIRNDELLDNRR